MYMLSTKQNINFENQALPIFKIRPPNITLLQKILRLNFSKVLSEQYKIMITAEYFIETRRCSLSITFLQNFLQRFMLANIKMVWFGKNTNGLYVKNNIFQKIGEYPLIIAHMLNILHTKIKYNIIPHKLNVYKTFTK